MQHVSRSGCAHCGNPLPYSRPFLYWMRRRFFRPRSLNPCRACHKYVCTSWSGVCPRHPICLPMMRDKEIEILRKCNHRTERSFNLGSQTDGVFSVAFTKLKEADHIIPVGAIDPSYTTSLSGLHYFDQLSHPIQYFLKRNWFRVFIVVATVVSSIVAVVSLLFA